MPKHSLKRRSRRPEDVVGRPDDSMWTNKEKIENYEVSENEIERDEIVRRSRVNNWKEKP